MKRLYRGGIVVFGLLFVGVGVVLALWGARMLVEGHLAWKKCPVALCLAGLFLREQDLSACSTNRKTLPSG